MHIYLDKILIYIIYIWLNKKLKNIDENNSNITHLSFANTHSTWLDFSISKAGQWSLVLSLPPLLATTQILSRIILK